MRQNLSEWGSFYWVVPVVIISLLVVLWVDRKRWRVRALWTMLGLWFAALIYLMFLYRLPPRWGKKNLDFFHMFRSAVNYTGSITTNKSLRQILFNVLLYVPLGVVLCSLTGKIWLTVLIGTGLSIVAELLQYWLKLGMADIDDVITNILGLIFGMVLYRGFKRVIDT